MVQGTSESLRDPGGLPDGLRDRVVHPDSSLNGSTDRFNDSLRDKVGYPDQLYDQVNSSADRVSELSP